MGRSQAKAIYITLDDTIFCVCILVNENCHNKGNIHVLTHAWNTGSTTYNHQLKTNTTNMPPYESTVGESDLELGQEYFGSIVTKVDQRVSTTIDEDDVEMYIVKRSVTLRNGVIMKEEYRKEKALGKIEDKKYELPKGHFGDEPLKDDSDARAKAKALMKDKKKKKSKPKKNKSAPPSSPKKLTSPTRSPRKKKSRSKSITGMEGIEPWFNFEEMKKDEPKKERPRRRSEVKEELGFFEGEYDPFSATIVPGSTASSAQSTPVRGVWKHTDGTDDTNWNPMDVLVSKKSPQDLQPEESHGILAIAEGLNPKSVGRLRPDQMKFLPPGTSNPPAFFKVVGYWRSKDDWPPVKPQPAIESITNDVGKLKLEEIWAEKIPTTAIVYPRNDAPDCHDDPDKEIIIAKGTWKFSEDKPEPEGADTWVPTYVQLDLDGSFHYVEDDNNIDDEDEDENDMYESFCEKPHGVWGLNPSEDANAANPSDLWFYPPDEEMDDDFKPIGKWKMMKESLWPPKSIGQVRDMRKFKQYKGSLNNVGKLKMPAFFSGK